MAAKRKMSYEQSRSLEKANEARRVNQRRHAVEATMTPEQTPEQKAKWEAERKAAVAAYRAKNAARTA